MNDINQQSDKYQLYDHTMKHQEDPSHLKLAPLKISQQSQHSIPDHRMNTQNSKRSLLSKADEKTLEKKIKPQQQNKLKQSKTHQEEKNNQNTGKKQQGRLSIYKGDEENLRCKRFPHLKECFCECAVSSPLVWVKPCIAVGGMRTALETKDLLAEGVTHILNVSSSEYFKRSHYFTYLNIDVYDNNDEDVKKNFRITNRFLSEALARKGKVLVHDQGDFSRAVTFILAFFINNYKVSLKQGLEQLRALLGKVDISTYFIKQLEQYDLEKLANSNLKTRLN